MVNDEVVGLGRADLHPVSVLNAALFHDLLALLLDFFLRVGAGNSDHGKGGYDPHHHVVRRSSRGRC